MKKNTQKRREPLENFQKATPLWWKKGKYGLSGNQGPKRFNLGAKFFTFKHPTEETQNTANQDINKIEKHNYALKNGNARGDKWGKNQ